MHDNFHDVHRGPMLGADGQDNGLDELLDELDVEGGADVADGADEADGAGGCVDKSLITSFLLFKLMIR